MSKLSKFSPANKIDSTRARHTMGLFYLMYLLQSVVLAVVTGFYLWDKETGNVSVNFENILTIYFALLLAESVRYSIIILANI